MVNHKIAVGVSGGIATYKACELVRELKKAGADVRVAMTDSARQFVSELTFATLSENPVTFSLFEEGERPTTSHIELARWCNFLVICPSTANFIAKVAAGMADDFLSTTILATSSPVMYCPAMNSIMWEKEAVQSNIATLKSRGYTFVDPEWGALATSAEGHGLGRLAAIEVILGRIRLKLQGTQELKGKKVVITAGPTREPIDPVRFITNYSSGKMGFALAEAAKLRNADVVLIAGPNHLPKLDGVKYLEIETALDLKQVLEVEYPGADVLLMAAAVSDYKPKNIASHKIKKNSDKLSIELERNPDILSTMGKRSRCVRVGFALETENEIVNATKKLNAKRLDMIVLNNPLQPDAAFAGDTNVVTIITKEGQIEELEKMSKLKVAEAILDRVEAMMMPQASEVVA